MRPRQHQTTTNRQPTQSKRTIHQIRVMHTEAPDLKWTGLLPHHVPNIVQQRACRRRRHKRLPRIAVQPHLPVENHIDRRPPLPQLVCRRTRPTEPRNHNIGDPRPQLRFQHRRIRRRHSSPRCTTTIQAVLAKQIKLHLRRRPRISQQLSADTSPLTFRTQNQLLNVSQTALKTTPFSASTQVKAPEMLFCSKCCTRSYIYGAMPEGR